MSDWSAPLCETLVCGMSSSGKTTFAYRYLLNVSAACRFVFDFKGEAAQRLRRPYAATASQLEAALATRWVLFNPHIMFEGETDKAFRFFCHWVFQACKRGPGKKVLLADEIWQWCTPQSIPIELARISQMGRAEGLELMSTTQLPHKYHSSLTGQSSEMICFRLDERLALDAIEGLGADRAAVQSLPLGSFISWNRITRGRLAGQVF